jgi:hypothetical protein
MGLILEAFVRKSARSALVAIVAACAATSFSLISASADPWPFSVPGFHPDQGPSHGHCFVEGDAEPVDAMRERMVDAMQYMDSNTQANLNFSSPCDRDGPGETDVVWRGERVFFQGEEVIGLSGCSSVRGGVCDRYRVFVNGPLVREHYSSEEAEHRQYRKTSCHELGHTLGLDHYATEDDRFNNGDSSAYNRSCQRSGFVGFVTDNWTRQWEGHHIDHINDWF